MIVDHDRNETSDLVEFVILYLEIERLSIVTGKRAVLRSEKASHSVSWNSSVTAGWVPVGWFSSFA